MTEREREALMRLTMCAREECGMCKYEDTCDFDFQYETATRCMNILADALRKTEPQIVKKYDTFCGVPMAEAIEVMREYKASKTEPFDKDINVRSKTEPQTEIKVEPTWVGTTYGRFEDEPQTSGTPYEIETSSVCKTEPQQVTGKLQASKDEPQTDCAWVRGGNG